LQSLISQTTTTQFLIVQQTAVIIQPPPPVVLQVNNRVIAGSTTNSPITVELDTGIPNPAIGMVISGTTPIKDSLDGELRSDEVYSLDASLLPVILTRGSNTDQMSAPDKVLWPPAALITFSEGGVWAVMATFLPDNASGQNPSGTQPPVGQNSDELEDMLRERFAPPTGPANRGANIHSGALIVPSPAKKQSEMDQTRDGLPGVPLSFNTSAKKGDSVDEALDESSDWMLMVATSLAAAGITTLHLPEEKANKRKANP
jgi:hypothetical protein